MKILGVELTEQECVDIMTTVIESDAINYWCETLDWKRDKELDVISISIVARDDEDELFSKTIYPGDIKVAVNKIVTGDVECSSNIRELILNEDVDQDVSDCVIQVACFNQIIFS